MLELTSACLTDEDGHAVAGQRRVAVAEKQHACSRPDFSLADDILAEHFTRNVQFFGREGQEKIMQSFVVVIGLGVGCVHLCCAMHELHGDRQGAAAQQWRCAC